MHKILLKHISIEQQVTLFLPVVSLLLLLGGVLCVHKLRTTATEAPEAVPPASATAAVEGQAVSLLLIQREQTHQVAHLTLVRVDPSRCRMTVAALPPERFTGETAVRLAERVETVLSVSPMYYLDMTYEGLRRCLQYYGAGISVTLPEAISYTDADGLSVRYPAGRISLSANQAVELLRLTEDGALLATIWRDLLQTAMAPDRQFLQDYTFLTTVGETDIRIYHFHRYAPVLEEMAAAVPQCVEMTPLPADYDAAMLKQWKTSWEDD